MCAVSMSLVLNVWCATSLTSSQETQHRRAMDRARLAAIKGQKEQLERSHSAEQQAVEEDRRQRTLNAELKRQRDRNAAAMRRRMDKTKVETYRSYAQMVKQQEEAQRTHESRLVCTGSVGPCVSVCERITCPSHPAPAHPQGHEGSSRGRGHSSPARARQRASSPRNAIARAQGVL